jgi:hypothetical protein
MDVIEIYTGPQDLLKLRKRVAPFRPPVLVRRQVARNNVRTKIITKTWAIETRGERWTEVRASSQVGGRVGFRRPLLQKVGVMACGVIEVWRPAGGVATIAVTLSVDNEATQSYQIPALSLQIQVDRRYLETYTDQ